MVIRTRNTNISVAWAAVALLLASCSGSGVAGDEGLETGSGGAGGDSSGKGSGKGGDDDDGASVTVGTASGGAACNTAGCFTANPTPCDDNLALDDGNATNAAKAIGICATAATDGFGLMEARWVRANGDLAAASPQVGILGSFGSEGAPLEGTRILGLSSGHARVPGQPDACDSESCEGLAGIAPPGFPQDVPNCAGGEDIGDDIGLEVRLKAPSNATGFKYRFRFYSF